MYLRLFNLRCLFTQTFLMGPTMSITYIDESDINHFMSAGANRVLVKPMDVSDFHSAMASVSLSTLDIKLSQ